MEWTTLARICWEYTRGTKWGSVASVSGRGVTAGAQTRSSVIMIRLIGKGEGKRRFNFMFGAKLLETRLRFVRDWSYAAF